MNVRPPCVVCRVPVDCPCLREGDRRPKMRTCALQPTGVYPQSRLFSAGDGSPGAYSIKKPEQAKNSEEQCED